MKSVVKLFSLVFALAFFVVDAYADAKRDFYIQQKSRRYFNLPQNAHTFGMAGSSVATRSDSSSVIGNPAGLGFMKDAEVSGTYDYQDVSGREHPSYNNISEEIHSGHALGATPIVPYLDALPEYGNLGLGWSGYRSDVDDSLNTETKGHRIHAAYGKALSDSLSVGYGFTYFNDKLDDDVHQHATDDGYRHTLGVQTKASDVLTLGASAFYGYGDPVRRFKDTGVSHTLDSESVGGEVGAAYDLGGLLLATSVDYAEYRFKGNDEIANENGRSYAFRLGAEQEITDWLVGRLGYRYQGHEYFFGDESFRTGTAKYNAASWGAGVWLHNNLRIDYGGEYRWVHKGDFAHAVSMTVPFSICEEDIFSSADTRS